MIMTTKESIYLRMFKSFLVGIIIGYLIGLYLGDLLC